MEDYVRQHSMGTIIRSSFYIYRRHFWILLLSSVIPFSPLIALQVLHRGPEGPVIGTALLFALGLLNIVPMTILISDICVGNEPGLARAYRRAFGRPTGTVLLTVLLVFVLLMVGFLLLIVPGLFLACWFMFAVVVAVLERTSAREALGRSRQLGKGHYVRNGAIQLLATIIAFLFVSILSFVVGLVGGLGGVPVKLLELVGGFIGLLAAAPPAIAIVLLYYDMRVRKEAYDSTKLAEDLRH